MEILSTKTALVFSSIAFRTWSTSLLAWKLTKRAVIPRAGRRCVNAWIEASERGEAMRIFEPFWARVVTVVKRAAGPELGFWSD